MDDIAAREASAVSVRGYAVKVIAVVGREHAFPFHQAVGVISYNHIIDI